MCRVGNEHPSVTALEQGIQLWSETLTSPGPGHFGSPALEYFGVTEMAQQVEGQLEARGLTEHEARTLSDLAFKLALWQEA